VAAGARTERENMICPNFPANNGKQLAVNLTKGEQENGI